MVPCLNSSDLKLVRSNFQNIYLAAHDNKEKNLNLVPAIFGSRLYEPKSSLKGRVLSFLHILIACFFSKSFKHSKLQNSLKKTANAFLKLENFRRAFHDVILDDYINFGKENVQSRYTEKQIGRAKKEIKKFYFSTYPLSRLIKKGTNQKINDFVNLHFNDSITTPFYPTTFKTVKSYIRLMAMEGMLSTKAPLHIFKALKSDSIDLAKSDLENVQKFVKEIAIAKNQGRFQVKMFQSILKNITYFYKENNMDLRDLSELLIKEGCVFLDEMDDSHIEWRNSLLEPSKLKKESPFYYIDSHSKDRYEVTLANRIQTHIKERDLYHVYEIHDKITGDLIEDKLLIIPPNKMCLDFMEIMRFKKSFGLLTPEVFYIHPTGKYAVVKKLFLMVNKIQWKTKAFDPIESQDLKYAHPIRVLMQFFVEEKNSPKDLSVHYLGFDERFRLKTTKDFVPSGEVDYLLLEEIIYEIVHEENLSVYQYIIEPLISSTFCKKRLNAFFKDSILAAFKKNPYPINVLADIRRVESDKTIEKGKALYKYAKKLKKQAIDQIQKLYTDVDLKKLRKELVKALIQIYEEGKTLGRFWNSIDEMDLVEKVQVNPSLFISRIK